MEVCQLSSRRNY